MSLSFSDLPDWQDKEKYPKEKDYSPSQWAWEFLRRNNDYRSTWNDFEKLAIAKCENFSQLDPLRKKAESQGGIAIAVRNWLDDFRAGKRAETFSIEINHYRSMSEVADSSLIAGHPWFLVDMLDPRFPLSGRVPFRTDAVTSQTGSERKFEFELNSHLSNIKLNVQDIDRPLCPIVDEWSHQPFKLHLSVDMRVPIGVVKSRLLEEVDRRYKEAENLDFQRIDKRFRADKYSIYLRVLDADRLGVSVDEIGGMIFSGQHENDISALRKQVRQTIDAAKDAQADYWRIAYLE